MNNEKSVQTESRLEHTDKQRLAAVREAMGNVKGVFSTSDRAHGQDGLLAEATMAASDTFMANRLADPSIVRKIAEILNRLGDPKRRSDETANPYGDALAVLGFVIGRLGLGHCFTKESIRKDALRCLKDGSPDAGFRSALHVFALLDELEKFQGLASGMKVPGFEETVSDVDFVQAAKTSA